MSETPLSPLEDAVLRNVLAMAGEGDGWLDLTRLCSMTGRMLPDVREAVHRLARRRLLFLDEKAAHTPRWMRFLLPEAAPARAPDRTPVV
ncbi:MAG: hypothetical protein IT460_01540 [Planctomycetes bacterium]|nr:hypothetical protein [Planctomycetota bacterium]